MAAAGPPSYAAPMATLLTHKRETPGAVVHRCARCRGEFAGQGYVRRGRHYCCDLCAESARGRGWIASLLIWGGLVGLGWLLGSKG